MNASVYIFGEFNSGYSQYPDDYASSIFQKFSVNAKSTTQIAIHRDGNLVYYGYIRKLQQDKYLGLCVVLNGLILRRIDGLFSLFENAISNLVISDKLIHFNEQGDLVTSVEKLYLNREEIELLTESLRAGFKHFESYSAPLPAVSYGTSKDSYKDFIVNDDQDEIVKSSYTNGYTYIYKSRGFNTAQLNSYKGVLCKVHKEKQELQEKLEQLEKEHSKTLQEKKQFRNVILLIFIVIFCGIGICVLCANLNSTQGQLENANDEIVSQNKEISNLYNENNSLNERRQAEESKREAAEEKLSKISSIYPFIVTSFNVSSDQVEFDYYCPETKEITITLKAINEDNQEIISNDYTLSFYKDGGSKNLKFDYSLNNYNDYSIVLIYKGQIIAGKHW